MPKTRKTIQLKNLAKYDVLVEDTSSSSTYFQVTNLPPVFTGGRNSFLIAGSSLLVPGSTIQIEILDTNGNTIYQNPVQKYVEGTSRLITVEINETTPPGFATIILLGRAVVQENGTPVPPNWQNSYNVRWTKRILVEPNLRNKSPLILENTPIMFSEEQRLYSVDTSSYSIASSSFTGTLTPTLYSSIPIGYLIRVEAPVSFSAASRGGYITGSLIVDGVSASLYVPITEVLNDTTAFSTGHLIQTSDNRILDKLYLTSGSYQTPVFGTTSKVTSSATIVYSSLDTQNIHIPISYAKLRVVNMNTVSGEIYKLKVYSKVATNLSDYKLIADVPAVTTELLVTSSIRGDLPIGDFNISPTASTNWYAAGLETSSNVVYPISGSTAYYTPTGSNPLTLQITDDILLRSVRANVPIYNNTGYAGYLSASGYFVGNIRPVQLFPTSEYTLQFDAIYNNFSGSANLTGVVPKVDIYVIGVSGSKIVDDNPLGQKIGTLTVNQNALAQRYQLQQFNFTPRLATGGFVGIRFVVSNGFWYFSDISLKPASDKLFAPDEVTFVIPNTEHFNEYLQHKVEFFDINNNSTDVSVISIPTFFTGSNIDLGILP